MKCFACNATLLSLLLAPALMVAQPSPSPETKGPPIQPPGPEFGSELKSEPLGVGPTMDVAAAGDFVYAIGKGQLTVLSGARSGRRAPVGRLTGLGNVRQVALSRGHAFITAREDGLFIVDVRDPAQPRLVNHYDTAELATGIAVSGEVAAVANRFAGVELVDVSKPAEPRHLATIRVGEAQSLVFHGPWLYVGAWSDKAVAVIDVRDPWQPRLVNKVPLDGYGDGLDVSGNLLAAATGHHAKTTGAPKPGDAAFGCGHGIEFFDISNPSEPRRLSGLKFPPFYRLGMDMWGVVLAGGHAFVNDTHNGFFLVDVRDLGQPRFAGWRQLPLEGNSGDPSPVAGLAVAQGRAFLAGAADDLHLVDTGLAEAGPTMLESELRVPPPPAPMPGTLPGSYQVNGSIRSALPWHADQLLVATGSAGLHVVRMKPEGFERVAEYPTRGFARDVAFHGSRIYVAESLGGLSTWEVRPDDTLRRIGAWEVPGKSIHQVVLADQGRIAFLAVGAGTLQAVRLNPDGSCDKLLETSNLGLFYREPFSSLALDGQRFLAQWHVTGLYEFTAAMGAGKFTGHPFPHRMDSDCGAAAWRDGWVVTSNRGLFFLKPSEMRPPEQTGFIRIKGRALRGKPSVHGNTVFISDPFLGSVTAVDLSDEKNPRLLSALQLAGHPGRVRVHQGKALIPAGREGLLLWDCMSPDR